VCGLLPLVLTLAQLVAVPGPGGGVVEAESALAPALSLLATLEDGRPLVQAFADARVRVRVAPIRAAPSLEPFAEYNRRTRTVSVAPDVARLAPATIATVLAHEGSHVRAILDGTVDRERDQFGAVAACQADEWRAVLTELQVWRAFHGPSGKLQPAHDYEVALNDDLSLYQQNPMQYRISIAEAYAPLCRPAGGHPSGAAAALTAVGQ
jgi:hypothetical protein